MLNYSDLTVFNNSDGVPTALGYPIKSAFMNTTTPLFVSSGEGGGRGGGKKKKRKNTPNTINNPVGYGEDNDSVSGSDYESLAVPAGLVCITKTICRKSDEDEAEEENGNSIELIPEGLYDKLLALAEHKQLSKKYSKKRKSKSVAKKNKKTKKYLKN